MRREHKLPAGRVDEAEPAVIQGSWVSAPNLFQLEPLALCGASEPFLVRPSAMQPRLTRGLATVKRKRRGARKRADRTVWFRSRFLGALKCAQPVQRIQGVAEPG
jgi:hypothetical protein